MKKLWLSAFAIGFITWTEKNTIRQVPSAAIREKVTDPSNAVVNGAVITTIQEQTGTRRMMDTSPDGLYRIETLDPGDYQVEFSTPGFATHTYNLTSSLLTPDVRITRRSVLVRGFTGLNGIHVELLFDEDIGRLATDLETALFRVAQESLSNVHLHSGSHNAIICATQHNAAIVLQIADRGRGIPRTTSAYCSPLAQMPGVGIMGMEERLRQLGGQLEIESGDQGTIVTARVPITMAELCCAS